MGTEGGSILPEMHSHVTYAITHTWKESITCVVERLNSVFRRDLIFSSGNWDITFVFLKTVSLKRKEEHCRKQCR